jgi:hypothetical protein
MKRHDLVCLIDLIKKMDRGYEMDKIERKSQVSNSDKSGLPFNRRNNTKLQNI